MSYEDYDRLEQNSVNTNEAQRIQRKAEYKKKSVRTKKSLKKAIAAFLLVVTLAIGAKLGYNQMQPYFNGSYVNQSYTVGYDSIGTSTHRTADNQGYWYDVDNIARLYDSSNMDFDSYVYGAYCGMDTNRVRNMDDLFWQFKMRGLTDYSSFTEYVKGYGCVKEVDGQEIADIDAWKDVMKKQIRVGNELKDAYSEVGQYDGSSDIDMYINSIYVTVGWNNDSRLLCMDELMEDLYNEGYSPYNTFFAYCQSKGFVKEKDGKMVIDESAYQRGYKKYVDNLEEIDRLQQEVDEFRNVAPTEEKGLGK